MLTECPHCSTRVLPMPGRVCPSCRKNLDAPPEPEAPEIAFDDVPGSIATTPELERMRTSQGLDTEFAGGMVRHHEDALSLAERQAGQRNMIFGALWC